jgi:histidinol dehydrogenase
MAHGTRTIPRVDLIVGPGNAYVAAVKMQVSNVVAIDAPAGPSELLVLADDTAVAATVAREMLAQAERDELASVIALVLGNELARQVEMSLLAQAAATKRASIVKRALEEQGGVLSATSREQMTEFATSYAPQHLLLFMANAPTLAREIRNAGTIVTGAGASVVLGDSMTGANHVLPTRGASRSYSGLSLDCFHRWTTVQTLSAAAAASLAPDGVSIAEVAGLDGHARAARALASSVRELP